MFFINSIKCLLPEIFLCLSSLILLIYSVFNEKKNSNLASDVSILAVYILIIAGIILILSQNINDFKLSFNFQLVHDNLSYFLKLFLFIFSIFILLLNSVFLEKEKKMNYFEYPLLLLFSIIGMCFIISSNDFFLLYIAIELQSLSLYIMAASNKKSNKSTEAGLKYFVLGALSSALLLFGISILYGFLGTTNFIDISNLVYPSLNNKYLNYNFGLLLGFIFIIIGILFKLPAAPFHNWAPDVYEGSPIIITAFFAVVPKLAIFCILVRITYIVFDQIFYIWIPILYFCAVLSLIIGCFGGLYQTNLKRLLAYSTINHIGYILMSLSCYNEYGLQAALMYLIIYLFLNLNIFSLIIGVNYYLKNNNMSLENIIDLRYIFRINPLFGLILFLNLFSIAGIPPLSGFFTKYYIFLAVIQKEYYFLAILAILLSVISSVYYIRLIRIILFDIKNIKLNKINIINIFIETKYTFIIWFILFFTTFINISFFFWGGWLVNLIFKISLIIWLF